MKEKIKTFIKSNPSLYKIFSVIFYFSEYLFYRYIIAKRSKSFYLSERITGIMNTNIDSKSEVKSENEAKLRWYIVQSYSGKEMAVVSNLKDRIKMHGIEDSFGEIVVPTEEVVEMRGGQKRKSNQKRDKLGHRIAACQKHHLVGDLRRPKAQHLGHHF